MSECASRVHEKESSGWNNDLRAPDTCTVTFPMKTSNFRIVRVDTGLQALDKVPSGRVVEFWELKSKKET